jgi:hypothetical protein
MEQCVNGAVDILDDRGSLLAVCTSCRVALGAATPEEKREATRQFDVRQRALFSDEH